MKLVVLVFSALGSMLGWWLGEPFGLFIGFVASILGFALGGLAGRRLAQRWALD